MVNEQAPWPSPELKVNPDLGNTYTVVGVLERGLASATGVGSVTAGDVFERGLVFNTEVGSVDAGML